MRSKRRQARTAGRGSAEPARAVRADGVEMPSSRLLDLTSAGLAGGFEHGRHLQLRTSAAEHDGEDEQEESEQHEELRQRDSPHTRVEGQRVDGLGVALERDYG